MTDKQDGLRACKGQPCPDHSEWNAAIEAAAKVAMHRWKSWPQLAPHELVKCDVTACEDISAAIRALKKGQTND